MVRSRRDLFETQFPHKMYFFHAILFMLKVKYADSIMMLVRLDLNLIVSLFQHKCEVSETVLTTTLTNTVGLPALRFRHCHCLKSYCCRKDPFLQIH